MPKRILIQGGGYIAVEFAGIFHGLGSQVTLVYRGENILRGFDDDVREHLRAEMERRGIKIICKQTVEAVEKVEHGLCVELSDRDDHRGRQGDVRDRAAARTLPGLGLEAAGVQHRRRQARIAVDEFSRTSVPHIYAVGDVTDRVNLTPVAIREGHAFADTVFGGKPTAVDHIECADGGVLRAGGRRDRADRGAGARAACQGRHLQDHVPADEDDASPAATRAHSSSSWSTARPTASSAATSSGRTPAR